MTAVNASREGAPHHELDAVVELQRARAQIAALEQLLEVHELTSLDQATRLERSLRERDELLERERESRAQLAESEARLRLALEAGRMGTWEWDIAHDRVIWSREEERLHGMPEGTFSGTMEEYRRRIHPDDRDYSVAVAQQALRERAEAHHIVHRIVRDDGTVRWLESHARFVYDPDGAPQRLVGVSADITERRAIEAARDQALAEARAERARLHEVFMQAPAAISVLEGPEHTFTVVNPLYRELVGGRDILGRDVRHALPELEGQGFFELIDSVYRSSEAFAAHEMSVRLDRDGDGVPEELFVDFVYQPLKGLDGRAFGIMVHAVETTDRVLARRRVEQLAAEQAAILGQIADVVITTDPRGNITFFNEAARTLYGELREGVPIWDASQPFQLLTLDGTPKAVESVPLHRALRDQRVSNEEWRVRRADGRSLTVLGSAVPLRASDGSLFGAAMTVRDVTEQRGLQRQLEHERSRLREVLMQAPAAISVTEGADHVIVMQNERARQLVGRDVVGLRIRDLASDEQARERLGLLDRVYRTGDAFVGREMRVRLPNPGGTGTPKEAFFDFVYQPLRGIRGDVYGILTHAVDVTEQVRARQFVEEKAAQLARLSRDLEHSNRELDQFAYVASHDLKAPLRGIANLTQWIEEDLGERVTGESREHMRLLKVRVHRMEALIDGILSYSRAGRVHHEAERVDARALVAEVVELLAPPASVEIAIGQDMPVLEAERVPLQQVFMNLIGNAIKYNTSTSPRVEIRAADDGAFVHFSIADNGPGIAPQFQERIWQIFQTLAPRDRVEGTGIGLSVVRKLVETRGGRAWVESQEGRGSNFHFTWPKSTRQ